MQATRDEVARSAKLATGVEGRHHYLQGRLVLVGVKVHRDPSPVVLHSHMVVAVDGDLDEVASSCQGLVHRVVYHLVHQMVKAPLVRAPDIHAGTPADGLQPLQHLDLAGRILAHRYRCLSAVASLVVCHYRQSPIALYVVSPGRFMLPGPWHRSPALSPDKRSWRLPPGRWRCKRCRKYPPAYPRHQRHVPGPPIPGARPG